MRHDPSSRREDKTMAPKLTTPCAGAPSAATATNTNGTRVLLVCGVVAGPLFIVVALLQVLTRDGFDLSRHPLSLLSLGDLGWVQISNFVVSGLLSVAFAVGLRQVPAGAGPGDRCCSAGSAWGWSRAACSSPTRPLASHPGHRRASQTSSAGMQSCTPSPRPWRSSR